MSNRLVSLVLGVESYTQGRTDTAQRLVLAYLAWAVNETKHVTYCFPSIDMIEQHTHLCRRSVFRGLKTLREDGWIRIETQPGRRSVYHLDIEKLLTNQLKAPTHPYYYQVTSPKRATPPEQTPVSQ